jgi:hypothetical protein
MVASVFVPQNVAATVVVSETMDSYVVVSRIVAQML